MKKTISIILILLIATVLFACTEPESQTTSTEPPKESEMIITPCCDRLNIKLAENGEYQVVNVGLCLDSDIVIPSKFNDVPVTKICDDAFQLCDGLSSITLSKNIKTIGNWVFYLCSSLEDIYYEGTVEEWNAIEKGVDWDLKVDNYTVHCSDGDIAMDGTVTYK